MEMEVDMAENFNPADEIKWENVLNHVVLPCVLPDRRSRYFDELKSYVLCEMENSIKDTKIQKTIDLFARMKRVHETENCSPTVVSAEINALKPGDSFAMFVHRQNCAFMLYVLPNEEPNKEPQSAIVATFPGNLLPGDIYKVESDIEVHFSKFNKYISMHNL